MASNEIEVLDAAEGVESLNRIAASREVNRRRFLATLGMAGAAAGAGLISGCSTTSSTVPVTTSNPNQAQIDVLNFALNLEYLEATFYSFIALGKDISTSLLTGAGTLSGPPSQLTFTGNNASQIQDILSEIAYDEVNHVSGLRGLLGSAAVARPAINLAAFGAITASNALSFARLLEDVGVTAYASAIVALDGGNVTFASQILGVESFHSGALRLVCLQNPSIAPFVKADSIDVPVFDPGSAATAAAGPSANGAFFATAGSGTATASNPAGMAFARTAAQVLAILYGSSAGNPAGTGTKSGGFFPNGVNGNLVSS
ncbi:MAG TPA: ferritin-like domain-containing protein [Acidobacteriaceae bacterium]|nr:ferritin-like domain-containing protein [Acidobacteriaceae bacterium]